VVAKACGTHLLLCFYATLQPGSLFSIFFNPYYYLFSQSPTAVSQKHLQPIPNHTFDLIPARTTPSSKAGAHDFLSATPQQSDADCPICNAVSTRACLVCNENFCSANLYSCSDCGMHCCGDCLDAHIAEGHWGNSDTAAELARAHLAYRSALFQCGDPTQTRRTNPPTNTTSFNPAAHTSATSTPAITFAASHPWCKTFLAALKWLVSSLFARPLPSLLELVYE
jgi:hypothetical protein